MFRFASLGRLLNPHRGNRETNGLGRSKALGFPLFCNGLFTALAASYPYHQCPGLVFLICRPFTAQIPLLLCNLPPSLQWHSLPSFSPSCLHTSYPCQPHMDTWAHIPCVFNCLLISTYILYTSAILEHPPRCSDFHLTPSLSALLSPWTDREIASWMCESYTRQDTLHSRRTFASIPATPLLGCESNPASGHTYIPRLRCVLLLALQF